jgi:hypothetical protein
MRRTFLYIFTIREILRSIHSTILNWMQDGIQCHTSEQLEFTLTCAGTSPLELLITGTSPQTLVDVITSRRFPIDSLTVRLCGSNRRLPNLSFTNLNMSVIKRLHIEDLGLGGIVEIMDSALLSTSEEISLHIKLKAPATANDALIKHSLLQRVASFHASFGQCDLLQYVLCINSLKLELLDLDEPYSLVRIPLPNLKSLKIRDIDMFNVFDLSNISSLGISGDRFEYGTILAMLPIRLSKLTLRSGVFWPNSLSIHHPYCFLHLKNLRLQNIEVQDSLQKYMLFPQLKHLELDSIEQHFKDKNEYRRGLNWDLIFSPNVPDLETLSFWWTTFDEEFVMKLQSLRQLQNLHIYFSDIQMFTPAFLENLDVDEYLPSLSRIDLNLGSMGLLGTSYENFFKQCSAKRPLMDVYCRRI